jgi:hypothetical protein
MKTQQTRFKQTPSIKPIQLNNPRFENQQVTYYELFKTRVHYYDNLNENDLAYYEQKLMD